MEKPGPVKKTTPRQDSIWNSALGISGVSVGILSILVTVMVALIVAYYDFKVGELKSKMIDQESSCTKEIGELKNKIAMLEKDLAIKNEGGRGIEPPEPRSDVFNFSLKAEQSHYFDDNRFKLTLISPHNARRSARINISLGARNEDATLSLRGESRRAFKNNGRVYTLDLLDVTDARAEFRMVVSGRDMVYK